MVAAAISEVLLTGSETEPAGRIYLSCNTLVRESCGQCSVFNLPTGRVYGLDAIATRMLQVLLQSGSLPSALTVLTTEYDVDPAVLSADLLSLARQLLADDIIGVAA
jgi:hypothetical protein